MPYAKKKQAAWMRAYRAEKKARETALTLKLLAQFQADQVLFEAEQRADMQRIGERVMMLERRSTETEAELGLLDALVRQAEEWSR